jgi:hypothetical protein
MAAILRAAGLTVTVGRYSIRVEGHSHFNFEHYGGDICDPLIDADAESVAELMQTAGLVSPHWREPESFTALKSTTTTVSWRATFTTNGRWRTRRTTRGEPT